MVAKLLCLVLALVAMAHVASAQKCVTCDFAPCCAPKFGAPTCVANKCGFKCGKGYFGCGATCFATPPNVVPVCNKRGEYSYKCKAGTQACADLCCPNGPRGSTVTCPIMKGKATCSFSCPGGFFRCGPKCYFPPPGANPTCVGNKKYTFTCTGGQVACGGLCCPAGPPGTKVACPKNPTSKAPYCSFACAGRALYCGNKCVAYADAKCIPYCEGAAVKCNCPAGYKRNPTSTGCVKA